MTAWLKFPIIIAIFLLLTLLQFSFFTQVAILSMAPNLVFIAWCIMVFFEDSHHYLGGLFLTLLAGFCLDIFLPFYFWPATIALLISYMVFKISMRFLKEAQGSYLFVYFIPIFLFFFSFYNTVLYLLVNFPHVSFHMPPHALLILGYNALIALTICWVYKLTVRREADRQLKLFN